jgi:hypothetical protein
MTDEENNLLLIDDDNNNEPVRHFKYAGTDPTYIIETTSREFQVKFYREYILRFPDQQPELVCDMTCDIKQLAQELIDKHDPNDWLPIFKDWGYEFSTTAWEDDREPNNDRARKLVEDLVNYYDHDDCLQVFYDAGYKVADYDSDALLGRPYPKREFMAY